MTDTAVELIDDLSAIDPADWNALAADHPFVTHAFLDALHATGCAVRRTGWQPTYLVLRRGGRLLGAMPLYVKAHSRGEYVFDHAWAEAFERHGLDYYPKLLCAVPFTPVGGPRLLAASHEDRVLLARAAIEVARQAEVSSLHVLFPRDEDLLALREAGYMMREGVQFHWRNEGYASFDAFLGAMNHDKRKKIRQDRKKVQQAGIRFRHLRGQAITPDDLAFFYRCYASTYAHHWSSPYLNPAFFEALHAAMPEAMLLVLAEREGEPVASALNIAAGDTLYGRYWGCVDFVSGLHFETCYLQAIEYCIANGYACFEGGAQGVHKMSRGLLPTPTWSAHWVADQRFAAAIADFLKRETRGMNQYLDELESHTPFKAPAERD
ncbi:MAG: GNAT family N-acetyltransferase [Pigmentiphaga sp.]|uniref:GNAT family N-acetyltransferase n=1 Tax=Pigmentiphaga sp. TaxID=1977564 RepID=UPI0029B0509F|nr:GNAT family N-acetyltransferase [Pigmentiphaga sp.]MDX3907676.1 GNAT family N-acetyltransferase [Pigmentiphaga sp.]